MGRRAAQSVAFYDPAGARFGVPTFPWRQAPKGHATRRQLAALGLRANGQDVAAQIMWRTRGGAVRVAYLYLINRAAPKRRATPRQLAALDRANAARRRCPECGQDPGYIPARRLGMCNACAETYSWAA